MLRLNTEYQRKSIFPRELKTISITQIREQAKALNLLDTKKYNKFQNIVKEEPKKIESQVQVVQKFLQIF